jgi:hypothetical protein
MKVTYRNHDPMRFATIALATNSTALVVAVLLVLAATNR